MRMSDWRSDVCSSERIGCNRIGQATSQIAAHSIVAVARLEGGRARRNHAAEVETGIRRNDIDQPARRVPTEYCPRRPAQDLDAVDLDEIGPGGKWVSLVDSIDIGCYV